MPKKCYPETFSCESSHHMNGILKSKVHAHAFFIFKGPIIDIPSNEIPW